MPDILPYNPNWPAEFQKIARTIRSALGPLALRIDHIGSTSIPGMDAKDIIDIQVTVKHLDNAVLAAFRSIGYIKKNHMRDHIPPLEKLHSKLTAYADLQSPAWDPDWEKWYFSTPEGQQHAHIHVRVEGRPNQRYPLLFRDYLRNHPASARAYSEFKHRLSIELRDPDTYPDVKDPVVDLIYLAAEEWAERQDWQPGPPDF